MHRLTSRDKTQSWPLDKYSDTRFFGFLIIFSLVVTLSRIEFSLEEDMGIFITVSSLLNRGYRLYQDVTDINCSPIKMTKSTEREVLPNSALELLKLIVINTEGTEHVEDNKALLKKCTELSVSGTRYLER